MIFEGNTYKNVLCIQPISALADVHRYLNLNGELVSMKSIAMADLVLSFKNGEVNIIKNRYGPTKTITFDNEEDEAKFLLLL